ncbi:MAG: helix-turn-helix domain-containing protein [Spirochaetales bacterium]
MTAQVIADDAPLTHKEAAAYLKVSPFTLHRWTSKGLIPFYKPNGRTNYFKRTDLDAFVFRNRSAAKYELVTSKGGRK